MTIRGSGAVLIWNGIADGGDAEFVEWHVREHMPERVGLPGFLSGRRYTAIDGDPPYFNFYEVETPEVLRSAAYLARLNDPTPWTRKVVAGFTDVSRTLCHVAAVSGRGVGAFTQVLRFADAPDHAAATSFVRRLAGDADVCAAQLFLREEGPAQVTSETKLRRSPDVTWAAVLMAETPSRAGLERLRTGALSDAALATAGLPVPAGRGAYQLDYLIRHEDLTPVTPAPIEATETKA